MRDTLTKARYYMQKKECGDVCPDLAMDALIPVLKRYIPVHFHAHKADDILTAIRIAHEFNLRYNIIHATQAQKILSYMICEDSIPILGPAFGVSGKPETVGNSFATAGILFDAGLEVAITTDHDVTPLWSLPICAALYVRDGLPEDAALRAITINPAKILGIDNRVGSIAVGKDADIVVLDRHPFDIMTKAIAVFINGERI